MRIAILLAVLVAACVDPLDPTGDPFSTTDDPLIGGTIFTGPTRAVVINLPPAGTCTGILLTETSVLTSFHCVLTGVPTGTTVSHMVGATTETAKVVDAALDPKRSFVGPGTGGPRWEHDIAVLKLDPPLTIVPGSRDALFDDGSATTAGSVECLGAGAVVAGTTIGTGILHTLTFPIITGTPIFIKLKGYPATTSQPGDSGGPCWSTTSHRMVGIFQSYDTGDYTQFLANTSGATATWIAYQAFKTDMFDTSSSLAFSTTPAQWRIAKLDASTGKQIVGITSSGIEIIGGSRSGPGPIGLSAAAPVSLTGSPVLFTSPDAAFIDVTGDGLTDLVLPTASEVDVLPAAGAKRFHFPVVTKSLGSSAWTPATAQFGNIDGLNGRDYVWVDGTGAWVGLASTLGSFGTPTKQLSWTLTTGAVGLEQLDLTPGTDVGVLGSTTVTTYSALGLGTLSSIPNTSPLAAPGSSWELFSGFMPVDHKLPIGTDPFDWVAIRGQALFTQLNDLTGTFTTFNSTPVEVGNGWDLASTMADLNNDGSADWIGIDGTYIYVKPGLGTGRFGRLKMQEHGLGAITLDRVRLADIDDDGYLDFVVFAAPGSGAVTVLPFKVGSAPTVFAPLTSEGTWSWEDLLASMTRIAPFKALPLDLLCSATPCGSTSGAAGKRKMTGGGLLATLQVSAQGAPEVTALDDGMPRSGRWRWTPDDSLRATADLDGDGSDELVFTGASGIVAAARTSDGLALVVGQSFDTALGDIVLTADAQLANAGDTDHDGRDELLVQGNAGAVLASLGATGLEPRWSLHDTATIRGDTAAVQQQEQHAYAALAVVPGTHVRAVTTGSGDADLYLRFGAAPTLSAFDCRPYTGSANETCDLVVPQGVTTAWVMVVGYTAASYHLDVTYTPAEGLVAPAGDLDHDGYADLVVASPGTWTVYRGTPQGPAPAFAATAALGDRVIGSDTGLLVARADGIWRLTAQGSWCVMPWGLGLDGSARVVGLGDVTGDGQTDFAAIAQGALWLFSAGPNGPAAIAASGVPAGARVLAAGELDENPGAEVVVANAQQLVVYGLPAGQLVPRATATLGVTPDPVAAVTASSQLPRTGARRSLVVQLTSLTPPQ